MTDTLCPKHAAVVARCITNTPHLDAADQDRLRADYARFCRPGRYGCSPLDPAPTQETR